MISRLINPLKNLAFRLFGGRLIVYYGSTKILDLRRFTKGDIFRSIEFARNNHPGSPLYLVTDVHDRFNIQGVSQIKSWQDVESSKPPPVIILACNSDQFARETILNLKKAKRLFYYYGADRTSPMARYFHQNDTALKVLKEAATAQLDKWDLCDFENIIQAIEATRDIEGDYVEIGVYKGSSAYVALSYMEQAKIVRKAYLFDTFSGFDYAEAQTSADRGWFLSHGGTIYETASVRLRGFHVPYELIKSNIITDELPKSIKKIAVCNIDVDMYEAILSALYKIAPLISEGGIIILEDQGHTPLLIGAFVAVKEFLESPAAVNFVPVHMMSGQLFLIKKKV